MGGANLLQYFRPGSLRHGLVLIVLVALLPLLIVSVFQSIDAADDARKLADGQLAAKAKALAESKRDPFIVAQHLLMTVASNPDVRQMSERCVQPLAAARQGFEAVVNFVRSDATGAVRCSVLPFADGTSYADLEWWRAGIKSNRMTISAPVIGTISQKPILILMLPLRSIDGGQDGAVSAGIDVTYLNKKVKAAPYAETGLIALVSDNGQTVAGTDAKLPFRPLTSGEAGTVRTVDASDGETWMYASASVYGPNLHVVYAERKPQMLKAAVSQIRAGILLPIGAILLAWLAIWFGTHRLVVRWLSDLGRVADDFAKGDFSGDRARFGDAPREIAELSSNLHTMAEGIDKQNRELNLALEAKTDLTREVHHRVKNNLQIITSLLTLQASRVEEPAAQQVLGQTRARISALALIHRLLYQQDPENESERGKVAIANLMEELCIQLRAANRDKPGVDLQCRASTHSITADQAVPLALFAVEALTNAYRHAFINGRAGKVTLNFLQADDSGVLTIEDDGQGFDADDDIGQMGLELMNAFASQLSGSVSIESKIDTGSRVTLTFPASSVLLD